MAAVDAIWRTHIKDKNVQENVGSTFELFCVLHPKDSSKLVTNPGYCMLNDGIQHLLKTHLLVCWEHVMEPSDLRTFAETGPDWDDIEAKVKQILHQYVTGHDFQDLWIQPDNKHDWKRENQLLFNWDSLMYALLALVTHYEAIGLMQDLLWHWVPMILACSNHKYATHLTKFI